MKTKMIIEARVNEYAMRDVNPHVPWTAEEIAETAARCREAGASILHFHARGPDGSPLHTAEENGKIIRKVREKCDILILPTLGFFTNDDDPMSRMNCIATLAGDPATKPDIVPIDTGSTNLETWDPTSRTFSDTERVYENRTDVLIGYAQRLKTLGIKPKMTCWSVGFVRRAIAFVEAGLVDEPAYFLLNMTDGNCLTGHPGSAGGLRAYVDFLPRHLRHSWTANVVGGNLVELCETAAKLGGNIAPGIGDHPYKEWGCPTNEELVSRTAKIARSCGREIARPQDVRDILEF